MVRIFEKTLLATMLLAVCPAISFAHGPQIQITGDEGKIVTRELIGDGPYSDSLTSPISAYVMPVLPLGDVWYSRPNTEADALDPELPAFYSGPGFAYGYDQAVGGPQAFAAGSELTLKFTNSLKVWNGIAFETEATVAFEAFRGATVAKTTSAAPYQAIGFTPGGISENYGSEGAEAHGTIRYRMLGDGTSASVTGPDGIYLMTMQLESTAAGLSASDPFYFVLHKNASPQSLSAAVASLGFDAGRVQYVPEPSMIGMLALAGALTGFAGRRRSRRFASKAME
jgi:hypothetical protein